MSDANDYVNRRTTEFAVKLRRTFMSDTMEEAEGGLLLYAMVAVALGSCLVAPEPGEGVTVTVAPPMLREDGDRVLAACRAIVAGDDDVDDETADGDCLCALLQAALVVMRPALLVAVAERLEDARKAN